MINFDKLSRIELDEAADFLLHRLPFINSVDLVIQLGSGQNPQSILDDVWDRLSLHEMPYIPTEESLAKHKLEIIWGTAGPFKLLIYTGRFHLYEGYGRVPCILPIWAASVCGARNFLFANAALGLNENLKTGDFMIFSDHVNNFGVSSLAGHQHLLKSPYIDMTKTYSPTLSSTFLKAASREGLTIQTGVYMANTGPQYNTPAELQLAKMIGADALGMSTVLEATTAHALNAKVLAVSMITNTYPGTNVGKRSHGEVFETGKAVNKQLTAAIKRWLKEECDGII